MENKFKLTISNIIPLAGLLFLILLFSIITGGRSLSLFNMTSILDQSIPLIIGGVGMIFVVAQGSTDMSQGSTLALCGTIAALAVNEFGFGFLFPTAILVGLIIGFLNGFILSKFNVSSLTITLAMLIGLRALVAYLTQGEVIYATPEMISLNSYSIKIPIFIFLVLLMGYIFEYTKYGYYSKAIGENEVAGKYAGVSIKRYKIIAFMLSGMMAGVVGALTISRIGGVSPGMGNFFELQVMMALFIGGVPVTGGMKSRIYKLLIGAPTISVLENGLVLCGVSSAFSELIEGIVLILVVYITLRTFTKPSSPAAAGKRKLNAGGQSV